MKYNSKGKRRYRCADCGTKALLHWVELARKCKPRCQGCGGSFFEPDSEGASEMEVNAGTARAIKDHQPPHDGKDTLAMRGERDIPGVKP